MTEKKPPSEERPRSSTFLMDWLHADLNFTEEDEDTYVRQLAVTKELILTLPRVDRAALHQALVNYINSEQKLRELDAKKRERLQELDNWLLAENLRSAPKN